MCIAGKNLISNQQLKVIFTRKQNPKKEELMKIKRKLYSSSLSSNSPWNRSEHMKALHAQGRYTGTSKIGLWNSSEEKRLRMAQIMTKNALDKNAKGYGSEYAMRVNNRNLLFNKFQGEQGYMYFVKFPKSVKIGFSKDWDRRINYQFPHMNHILGGQVIAIISGPTTELADLEFDTLIKFQDYTKLNETGTKYTEFLDLKVKKQVYDFLKHRVSENKDLEFLIQNSL